MPSLSRAPNKKELEKLISIYLKAETAIINDEIVSIDKISIEAIYEFIL